jgi:ubiquinone/menaquinone biosynthesis C-methylase UbiE
MSEWKKKREAMLHYDQTAASYDSHYSEEQNAKLKAALEIVPVTDNSSVLDIGCGTGLLFPYVANKAKLLVGIDISPKLLKQAKKRARQHPSTHLILADADKTPFKNQTFQNLFAITLLQNMPDPTATLKEMKRITKPEATIVLTTLKKKFTQKAIIKLLKKTELKTTTVKTTPTTKDHIIMCHKPPVHMKTSK